MENTDKKKIKLEVEIPTVIYMALLENKMRNQDEILEQARQGVVETFYNMYRNPSLVPVPLKQYFEANFGTPPELTTKRKSKKKTALPPAEVSPTNEDTKLPNSLE